MNQSTFENEVRKILFCNRWSDFGGINVMLLDALIMIIIRFGGNTDTKSLDVLGALLIITWKKMCVQQLPMTSLFISFISKKF